MALHSICTRALTFQNFCTGAGSSLLATGGIQSVKQRCGNVRIWDMLRPATRSCLASISVHEGGCSALLAVPCSRLLLSGGIKGDIVAICCTSWAPLVTIPGHKGTLTSLAMAPSTTSRALGHFVSGGADGDIKVWDLQMMLASNDKLDTLAPTSHGDACVQHLADCHEKSTQTLGATYGVLDLVSTRSALLTCGADGRLVHRPWLMCS